MIDHCPQCGGNSYDIGIMNECEDCKYRFSILEQFYGRDFLLGRQIEFEEANDFPNGHYPGYDEYFSNGETLEIKDGRINMKKGIDH